MSGSGVHPPERKRRIDETEFAVLVFSDRLSQKIIFERGLMEIQILPEQAKKKREEGQTVTFLDVREQWEYDLARIEGSILIPLGELQQRINDLDQDSEIIVYCHHGVRSFQATMFLRQMGFNKVQNLAGGIDAWSLRADPSVPRYQGL
jgi:rhodanese-related sulfurtransferase